MLEVLVVFIVVLLVFAAVHDAVARRRGRYRSAEEWRELSDRRKGYARAARRRRSHGANLRPRD